MKNTNPIFSLKNFRSFGEEGADFELAPITVLTGCNSAGKSSLVKALMLLSEQPFDKGYKTDLTSVDPEESQKIGFERISAGSDVVRNSPSKELIVSAKEFGLGRFDKVLNHYSENGAIEMSYRFISRFLQEELIVKRSFCADNNLLNDGFLNHLSIEREDGTILYKYFFNNKTIEIIGLDYSDQKSYTIGWDESFNINPILEKCDRYNDAVIYRSLIKMQKRIELVLLHRTIKKQERNDEFVEELERKKEEITQKIDQIKSKWGDTIVGFILTEDWKSTYPKSERKPMTELDKMISSEKPRDEQQQDERLRKQNNVFNLVANDCLYPWFIKNITYIDSSSATVKRLYSVEDENKMCVALGKLVKQKRTGSYVNKWLKMFGIADSIEVVGTSEGIGIMVYLIRGEEKCLLADEGYGITQLVSLFLQMENTIIENTRSLTITDPETFEETYEYYYIHSFIAIEEPEIHLHPKYQSLLADMFVEAYQKYNIHFIIETHSEYLIRKLQVLVADKENALAPNDVSLNYVDKDENGISHNRKINIREDGSLDDSFGKGFYDEADSLALELFRRKPILS